MLLFDKIQGGFETVKGNFNGLQELLKRSDAPSILADKYMSISPEGYDVNWSPVEKGKFAVRLECFEIILAQPNFLQNLDRAKTKALVRNCLEKAAKKTKHPDIYSVIDLAGVALLTGRTLQKESYNPFSDKVSNDSELQQFLKNAHCPSERVVSEILSHASQYNNQN